MSLAYLILAHQRPRQFARLFHAIHHRDDTIVLHVDARAPAEMHTLAAGFAAGLANVRLLPPRRIVWGGFGIVDAQLAAMTAALGSPLPWAHFVNLSGQDFPLRPRHEILASLSAQPEANFVHWFDPLREPFWKNARTRLTRYHLTHPALHRLLHVRGLGWRLRRLLGCRDGLPVIPYYHRRWPCFFRYFGGSNHVVLTRAACQYLTRAALPQRLARWLRPAANPDEIFYQSALLNGPLAATVVNDDRREIDFKLHAAHPRVFTANDLPRLEVSDKLWARKFDETVDDRILTLLSRRLGVISTPA